MQGLLSLPCTLTQDVILTSTPIIVKAEKIRDGVYVHNIQRGENLNRFLERIYDGAKTYDMDCVIFAQLAAKVLEGTWPQYGGVIVLCIALDAVSSLMLLETKCDNTGYITVCDSEVREFLTDYPSNSKGTWAIKVNTDQYLALGENGVEIKSLEEWIYNMQEDLRREAFTPTYNNVILQSMRGILRCYFELNRLTEWKWQNTIGCFGTSLLTRALFQNPPEVVPQKCGRVLRNNPHSERYSPGGIELLMDRCSESYSLSSGRVVLRPDNSGTESRLWILGPNLHTIMDPHSEDLSELNRYHYESTKKQLFRQRKIETRFHKHKQYQRINHHYTKMSFFQKNSGR